MWFQILIVTTLTAICLTDKISRDRKSGRRQGDVIVKFENILNEEEKQISKKFKLKKGVVPARLPPQDLACFAYDESMCSEKMLKLKSVLIQSIKEDCAKCSAKDKKMAGSVAASIINQDPVAWKLLLKRSGITIKNKEKRLKGIQRSSAKES